MSIRFPRPLARILTGLVILSSLGLGTHTLTPGIAEAAAPSIDMSISKSIVEPGPYHAGQQVTYRIVAKMVELSPAPAFTIRFTDRFYPGTQIITAIDPSCTLILNDLTCDFPVSSFVTTSPGATRTIIISYDLEVRLPTRLPGDKTITNQLEINPQRTVQESNYTNNRFQLSTTLLP